MIIESLLTNKGSYLLWRLTAKVSEALTCYVASVLNPDLKEHCHRSKIYAKAMRPGWFLQHEFLCYVFLSEGLFFCLFVQKQFHRQYTSTALPRDNSYSGVHFFKRDIARPQYFHAILALWGKRLIFLFYLPIVFYMLDSLFYYSRLQ